VIKLLVVASIIVGAAGCSITHRSDAFGCTKQSDCTDGRLCINNFCVTGVTADAPSTTDANEHPDADGCPTQCTSCDKSSGKCTIDCSGTNTCNSPIQCPAGFNCDITCGDNSCRNGIDCAPGTGCTIDCNGDSACRNINCGQNRCDVTCGGDNSCRGVDCSASCACDVSCFGLNSCGDNGASCPLKATSLICDTGMGCTSIPPMCDTCQ
jgi:hypothetical protein